MSVRLIIAGGSGAVGVHFLNYILAERPDCSVILLSNSITGFERLSVRYSNNSQIELFALEEFLSSNHEMRFADYTFLNFAFPGIGAPWLRIKESRVLINRLTVWCKGAGVKHYIEISSQSVFGYKFDKDVTVDTAPPFFKEEYGFTKKLAEDIVRSNLSNSDVRFTIIRLGNVLFRGSGPFYQRLYSIVLNSNLVVSDFNGYCNATIIENVVAGVLFVVENEDSEDEIYHFSELSHLKWKQLVPITLLNILPKDEPLSRTRSKYSTSPEKIIGVASWFLSYVPSDLGFLKKLIKAKRKLSISKEVRFPSSALLAFNEKYRFLPHFPKGFRYKVPLKSSEVWVGNQYRDLFNND